MRDMNIKKVGICSLLFLIVACSSAHAGVTLINGQVLGDYISAVTWLGSMDGGGYDLTNVDELNATKFNQNGNDVLDTTDNTSMAGYVDSQDTAFNTSIGSYVDSQNGVYNTSMKSYADAQDVAYNTSMGSYVDAQDTAYNTSIGSYVDAQDTAFNTSIGSYVDAQDTVYNDSMKAYVDADTINGNRDYLVEFWPFEANIGSIAYGKNGNDGVITNAVFTKGKFGYGLGLDGGGDYVTVPASDSLNMTNNISITHWNDTDFSTVAIWVEDPIDTPVLDRGVAGKWDVNAVDNPTIIYADSKYYLFYEGMENNYEAIGIAESDDGETFTKLSVDSPIVGNGTGGSWDEFATRIPVIYDNSGTYHLFYTGTNGSSPSQYNGIGVATSTNMSDIASWTKSGSNPLMSNEASGSFSVLTTTPSITKISSTYHMFVRGSTGGQFIGMANSSDLISWTRDTSFSTISGCASFVTQVSDGKYYATCQDESTINNYYYSEDFISGWTSNGALNYSRPTGISSLSPTIEIGGEQYMFYEKDDRIYRARLVQTEGVKLSGWFKLNEDFSSASVNDGGIFTKYPASGTEHGDWLIRLEDGNGKLKFGWVNPSDSWSELDSIRTSWAGDAWYHFAVVTDQTGTKMYINGELENSDSTDRRHLMNSEDLIIGCKAGFGGYINGTLDELKISTQSFSQEEIRTEFSSGLISHTSDGHLLQKLSPTASPPTDPAEGDLYSDTSHALCWYNSTAWVVVAGSGSCS